METEAKAIFKAIPKIMGEVGAITKTRKNQQQGYTFRGIDDIYNACQPSMIKHGVFVVPEVTHREQNERVTRDGKGVLIYTTLTVKHTLFADDGSSVVGVTIGEAMDSGDKSANKAMSAAMKYFLIETFCIPTEEQIDTENETHEVSPIKPAPELKQTTPAKPVNEAVKQLADYGDILDDDNFQFAYGGEFKKRDFTDEQVSRAVTKMCEKDKVDSIFKLALDRRHAFIEGIKSGKLDKFKTEKRATVGAGK